MTSAQSINQIQGTGESLEAGELEVRGGKANVIMSGLVLAIVGHQQR
jgi:hypothetical protein